jgi:hypothetical protein
MPLMRYSIRTLLLALVVISMALGIYRHRAETQRDAVRVITSKGGEVVYQGVIFDRLPDWPGTGIRLPNYPNWLTNLLGPDYVATVVSVYIGRDDRSLRYERGFIGELGPLVNPNYPDPHGANMIDVQDGVIEQIGRLRNLVALDLAETNVSDDNLEQLSHLRSLAHLRLGNCVTKPGVQRLQRSLPQAWIQY